MRTPTLLSFRPSGVNRICGTYHGLSVTGRAHDRLDYAGISDDFGTGAKFLERTGETVRRGRQSQILMRKYTQSFTIHADRRDFGTRHHLRTMSGGCGQFGGGDRFDFRHDDIRLDFIV